MKRLATHFAIATVLFLSTYHNPLLAQSSPCPPSQALLAATDPAYADAMDLSKVLQDHGFVVQCIFPTKLGSIFQVWDGGIAHSTIEGEAAFRTDHGDIDVVFMPKPQTFSNFTIKEHREGSGYMYKFGGTPRVWDVNKFGTARREHFLKHDNQLLLVGDNDSLLAHLEEALNVRPVAP